VLRVLCEAGRKRHEAESAQARVAFSDKERAVLRLAASGVSNEEIARCLGVSIHTVKWHLTNVYSKLGVKNRTAAVKAALAMDLV
jgi:LuxR family maltose regulon positive regulatory protein